MLKRQKFTPHFLLWFLMGGALSGCTPTVQLETPKEGITINMNVVVDHKISVQMDKETERILDKK